MTKFCWILCRIINVSDKSSREIQNTHSISINLFPKILPFYEIMWKSMVQPDRPQTTIWRKRIACRITKLTNTYTQYVILVAIPLQQWLHERISTLHLHVQCLFCLGFFMVAVFQMALVSWLYTVCLPDV
jgi:hypothetical protein